MFDIMAVDWGSQKIGIAYGSSATELVIPERSLTSAPDIWEKLEREFRQRKIKLVVIGWPVNFYGQPTEVTQKVQGFIGEMKERFPQVRIEKINERETTQKFTKESIFKDTKKLDNLAAQEILERYLQKQKK